MRYELYTYKVEHWLKIDESQHWTGGHFLLSTINIFLNLHRNSLHFHINIEINIYPFL